MTYECENYSAESYQSAGGYFVQADLMNPDGTFFRRARIAQCTFLEGAIQYARDRNFQRSLVYDSYLYNFIKENS